MKKFYRELLSSYKIKPYKEGFLLGTDTVYFGADSKTSFYIKPIDDYFEISDLGQTLSYLNSNTDIDSYREKISFFLKRFGAILYRGEIKSTLPPYESGQTVRCLNNFIFTVGLIANIDLI